MNLAKNYGALHFKDNIQYCFWTFLILLGKPFSNTVYGLDRFWLHLERKFFIMPDTVMILSFRTDNSWKTVQTQIRLLLEEQSNQGAHCLIFHLHHLDEMLYGFASLFEF